MSQIAKLPRYTVIIQWSEEDQVYVVSLPEWGTGAKTHGVTYEEAARNAQEALELLMQDSEPPQPHLFHYPGAKAVDLENDSESDLPQPTSQEESRQSA
jgi:antitoxin HicB